MPEEKQSLGQRYRSGMKKGMRFFTGKPKEGNYEHINPKSRLKFMSELRHMKHQRSPKMSGQFVRETYEEQKAKELAYAKSQSPHIGRRQVERELKGYHRAIPVNEPFVTKNPKGFEALRMRARQYGQTRIKPYGKQLGSSLYKYGKSEIRSQPSRFKERVAGHFLGSGTRTQAERQAFLKARSQGRMQMIRYSGQFKGRRSALGSRARGMKMPKPKFTRGKNPIPIHSQYETRNMYLQSQQPVQRPVMQPRPQFQPRPVQQPQQQYQQQQYQQPQEQGWFDFGNPPSVAIGKKRRPEEQDNGALTLW